MPLKWHGLNNSNFSIFVFVLIFVNNTNIMISRPIATYHCILNTKAPPSLNNSSCNNRYWAGFLNQNCPGHTFCSYLYALALRANQTGKIFLNSDDQNKCSSKMRTREAEAEAEYLGCGTEKLMAGSGGCSDFSTMEVSRKFGYELERLQGKCGTSNSSYSDRCAPCLRMWEKMKEEESEICSFAVLVTFVSMEIENGFWASQVFSCFGNERILEDPKLAKTTQGKKIRPGVCILIGGVVGLFVVVIFSVVILSRKRETSIAPVDKDDWRPALSNVTAWGPALSVLLSKESTVLKVSIEEVHAATNNLLESNVVGEGTAGKVYRGVLSNNQQVAIKKITNEACVDTFMREIGSLVHVRHQNLVSLMGYCENGRECFLIYQFCPNGNLSEWLYGKDKVLSWIRRVEIAIDCARGLRFLHTFQEGCIVHRDVKPTNILLGANFEAKLSDFGLSKVMKLGDSSVSSEVRGTFGYIDPEYQSNSHISAASDIYSYGVVLLQILSGRKAIDMNMKKPIPLAKIAKSVMKNENLVGFADPNLHGEYSVEAFRLVFELAMLCTGNKRQRSSINEVVMKLEEALTLSMRMEPSTPHLTPDLSTAD